VNQAQKVDDNMVSYVYFLDQKWYAMF